MHVVSKDTGQQEEDIEVIISKRRALCYYVLSSEVGIKYLH